MNKNHFGDIAAVHMKKLTLKPRELQSHRKLHSLITPDKRRVEKWGDITQNDNGVNMDVAVTIVVLSLLLLASLF